MAENENAAGEGKKRRRRWPWVLLAVVVALPFGLRAALPTLVERGAAFASRQWFGLPVRIDNVDFDLVDGRVLLEGVTVGAEADQVAPWDAALSPPPADPSTALLHLDRLAAHLEWGALGGRILHLTDLELGAPAVRVAREADGAIDPLRRARPVVPPTPDAGEEPAQEGEPWIVAVDRFRLQSPDVEVVDPPSGDDLLHFSLEKFELVGIRVDDGNLALGGVGIEGPVLRVRRDLVMAAPAGAKAATAPAAPSQPNAAPPAAVPVAASAPATPPEAAAMPQPPAPQPAATPAPAATPPPAAAPDAAAPPPATPDAAATPQPTAAPPPAAAPPPRPPGYRIDKIDIARATFTWVTDKGPLDVALALHASNVTADEGAQFPLDLQLEVAQGRIGIVGEVGILPPSYRGRFTWESLPFPPLLLASLPDLASWLRTADSSGDLTLDVDVAGARGEPGLTMSGRAQVSTLAIADPGDREVAFGWKSLDVEMREVVVPLPGGSGAPRTTRVQLESVRLVEPRVRYTHPSPALQALLRDGSTGEAPPATDAAAKPASPAPAGDTVVVVGGDAPPPPPSPVDVSIASLELAGGDAAIVDTTVTPAVTSTLKVLAVSARDVHFPDPSASRIHVEADLPTSSHLVVDGALAPGNHGDFVVSLKKLDLPVFSPYAMAAGTSLDKGTASIETKLRLRGKEMQVDNALLLSSFGVSMRDPSSFERSFGIPLDLALALLRDPAGDIRLSIPVRIDGKGTAVALGPVVASALKAALLGAVTAPLKMLGAAFSPVAGLVGGLSIAPVPGLPGVADPGPDAAARVESLAKLMRDRPTMGLELKGRTGPADLPVLAEGLLIEAARAGRDLPDVEGTGLLVRRRLREALKAKGAGGGPTGRAPESLSDEDRAVYERSIAATEVPAARLDALAEARASAVRGLLVKGGVEERRIRVGARAADGDPATVLSLAQP